MSKKIKSLVFLGLALVLTLSLVAVACAPKAPVGEVVPKADLTKAQADLAAEKQKTATAEKKAKDLEAELAALKKPAKVYNWAPSSWQSAGPVWDDLVYICEQITAMSDGLIVATPSAPGSICPVNEQLTAVISGSTDAMLTSPMYYAGQIPCFYASNFAYVTGGINDLVNFVTQFEDGRVSKIWQEQLSNYGPATIAAYHYFYSSNCIVSRVPIRGVADLKGVMFRTSEIKADLVSHFGAGTVWLPGDEIYTALATGAIDAMTYSNVITNLANSFHEVSKYWVRKPLMSGALLDIFVVNTDVWNGLPDNLKAMVTTAVQAGTVKGQWACDSGFGKAWKQVEAAGIEIIEWSDADIAEFLDVYAALYKEKLQVDAPSREICEIYGRFLAE